MCGRVFSTLRLGEVCRAVGSNTLHPGLSGAGRSSAPAPSRNYNMPPTSNLAGVVHSSSQLQLPHHAHDKEQPLEDEDFKGVEEIKNIHPNRMVTVFNWGWANGEVINCRGEELAEKPMFRPHLNGHRGVVVVNGTYEWTPDKCPYRYTHPGTPPMYIAVLFTPSSQCILLTVEANKHLGQYHHRMPVVLSEDEIDEWIDPNVPFHTIAPKVLDLKNEKWAKIEAVKVSKLVNNLKEKSADNILSESEYFQKGKEQGKTIESFFRAKTAKEKEVENSGRKEGLSGKSERKEILHAKESRKEDSHFSASSSSKSKARAEKIKRDPSEDYGGKFGAGAKRSLDSGRKLDL